MEIKKILEFEHEYEVEISPELSGKEGRKIIYFSETPDIGGKSGLQIKVTLKNNLVWFGVFSSSFSDDIGPNGVYSCPDINTLCVVCAGIGYIGNVSMPESWQKISVIPIKQVLSNVENKIILFVDYNKIVAYGSSGKLWESSKFWDEVEIKNIEGGLIFGQSFDPTYNGGSTVKFKINIKTGKVEK